MSTNKVKVWNDNDYPHREKYKGEEITIPAKSFIEMEYEEAVQFAGQFTSPVLRGDGTHDPRFFKKIRVERPKVLPFTEKLVNHANGSVAATPEELAKALEEFKHLRATDPDAERESRTEVAALRSEIDELKSLLAGMIDSKPGRKRKEA